MVEVGDFEFSFGEFGAEGEDLVVTIACVNNREIVGAQGKKEILTVATLVNEKPMILNATNCKALAKLYGKHIEDWANQSMTLFASAVREAFDPRARAFRVRPLKAPKPQVAKVAAP